MRVRLFTTYYTDNNPARQEEYLTALQNNLNNPLIAEVIVLHETKDQLPFSVDNLISVIIEGRPTFQQFFDEINSRTQETDINIIANSDIYFDKSLSYAEKIQHKEVFALNRWDVLDKDHLRLFPKYSTGDTWIFRGKIKAAGMDYYLGQLGCDNKILFDLKKMGFVISNPSLIIRSYHLHASNVRGEYSDPSKNNRIPAPYVYTIPNVLNNTDWIRTLFQIGPFHLIKLCLVRRSIRFQYYYDRKNNLIEHEHELIDSVQYRPWKYWCFHDFKLPIKELNRFRI
ncbi:MAG: hypothetical protein EP305_03230 [Bacteroidetes bacterium]|nr:MAG: hypothetical protein EP305_03230 [Bacteroidota bacterium]